MGIGYNFTDVFFQDTTTGKYIKAQPFDFGGEVTTTYDDTHGDNLIPFPNDDYECVGTFKTSSRTYKALRRLLYGWNRKQHLRLKQMQKAGSLTRTRAYI